MTDLTPPDGGLERTLDAALSRTLTPPRAPPQLRERLRAAMVQATDAKISEARRRFEREQRETQADLDQAYVRVRLRVLGTMVGGAFAAGAVAALGLPWLAERLGPLTPWVVASVGTAIGIGITLASWAVSRRGDLV
jgi:hypothetical protein